MKPERMGPCVECMWPAKIRGPHDRAAVITATAWFMIGFVSTWFFVSCLTPRGPVWAARWGDLVYAALWMSFLVSVATVFRLRTLSSILRSNLIGWTHFLFFDHTGQFHIHRRRPDVTKRTDTTGVVVWIPGVIFQVRSGGWFRKNRILHQSGKTWRIAYAWEGLEDIRIRDGFLCQLAYQEPEFLVEVVNTFHYLSGVIHHYKALKRIAEHLGLTNARLIERIKRERATMGRSEHARAARETLEAAFAESLPGLTQLSDRWTKMAIAEAAASGTSAG